MSALISPGCASIKVSSGVSPLITAFRTSVTQRGQSESVSLGKPSGGAVRSYDLSNGPGAQLGRMASPSGSSLFTDWNAFQATSDRVETIFEPVILGALPVSDSPRRN